MWLRRQGRNSGCARMALTGLLRARFPAIGKSIAAETAVADIQQRDQAFELTELALPVFKDLEQENGW